MTPACLGFIGSLQLQFHSLTDAQTFHTINAQAGRGGPCGFTSWIEDRWAQMHQNTGLITRHEHRAGIVKSCQAR